MRLAELVQAIEERAPRATAESWDNVGLLVGDPTATVRTALVSVDLTPNALKAAKKAKANLIVTHHPPIFGKGLGALVTSEPRRPSEAAIACVREGIAVFSAHTNFDVCALEVAEAVAHGLGGKPVARLQSDPTELFKLVTFVPETHVSALREAVCRAGAGRIGRYDQCTFSQDGEGTFRGGPDTDPFVGKSGRLTTVRERRFEVVVPRGLERSVVRALRASHPYEEVAYDLYPLKPLMGLKGVQKAVGYGVVVEFPKRKAFSDLLRNVKSMFPPSNVVQYGKPSRSLGKVGFVAGKGSGFIRNAVEQGCDLFITGEVSYHDALAAVAADPSFTILELGHTESECFFGTTMKTWLKACGVSATVFTEQIREVEIG